MFNLDRFIADNLTKRPVSMFTTDIEANKEKLTDEIKSKKVCVIGGASSISSSFIKAKKLMDLLKVYPSKHFFCISTDKAANPVNNYGS